MSIWEKLGFGGYRGFSREAEQLLQQAVELAGSFGCSQTPGICCLPCCSRSRGLRRDS